MHHANGVVWEAVSPPRANRVFRVPRDRLLDVRQVLRDDLPQREDEPRGQLATFRVANRRVEVPRVLVVLFERRTRPPGQRLGDASRSGWSSKASEAELKGVIGSGIESGGWSERNALKDRRSSRQRGRMGTSVNMNAPRPGRDGSAQVRDLAVGRHARQPLARDLLASHRRDHDVVRGEVEIAVLFHRAPRLSPRHDQARRGHRRSAVVAARPQRSRVRRRQREALAERLRVVPYERMSGWSSKASVGVERRRCRGLNTRGGRRDAPAKVLKDRRSPRERGRMGTSV